MVLALAALGTGCLCSPEPKPADRAHSARTRRTARGRPDLRRAGAGPAATHPRGGEARAGGGTAPPAEGGAAGESANDYWLERFGARMLPAMRAAYVRTPSARRYEQFGARLLEIEERERLLKPVKADCSEADVRAYWHLPDLAACVVWIRKRFPEVTSETGRQTRPRARRDHRRDGRAR